MNTTAPTTKTIELPMPGFPMVTRVVSKPLFPDEQKDNERISQLMNQWLTANPTATRQQISESAIAIATSVCRNGSNSPTIWTIGKEHPFTPECRVVRMFASDVDVEIYSCTPDGKSGMRNRIPAAGITLIEEAMPIDTFVEELSVAENGEVDDDEEEEEEGLDPEGETVTPPVQATNGNGQQPVS